MAEQDSEDKSCDHKSDPTGSDDKKKESEELQTTNNDARKLRDFFALLCKIKRKNK